MPTPTPTETSSYSVIPSLAEMMVRPPRLTYAEKLRGYTPPVAAVAAAAAAAPHDVQEGGWHVVV
jgi:hypothetical protein